MKTKYGKKITLVSFSHSLTKGENDFFSPFPFMFSVLVQNKHYFIVVSKNKFFEKHENVSKTGTKRGHILFKAS